MADNPAPKMDQETEDRFAQLKQLERADSAQKGELAQINPFDSMAERIFGAQNLARMRDELHMLQKLQALGQAAGDEWYYRYPVKDNRTGKTTWIEGPSINLANDLARVYGNCDIDTRVVDMGRDWMIYARFIDLETGYSQTRPFAQRKSAGEIGGSGRGADERRENMAFQIGVSKAIRNVVVNSLRTYANYGFEQAKNSLVEKIGKDLGNYRQTVAERISKHIDIRRVERVIGRSAKDWLAPDIAQIMAMMKAVSDGMASMAESFPPLDGDASDSDEKKSSEGLDDFAAKSGKGKKPAAKEQKAKADETEAKADESETDATSEQKADGGLEEALAEATRLGRVNARKGMNRRAVPKEIADDDALNDAYLAAFDEEKQKLDAD